MSEERNTFKDFYGVIFGVCNLQLLLYLQFCIAMILKCSGL